MELCCPLRIIPCVPEENGAIFFHIMNPLFTKLVILRLLDIGLFACLWTSTPSQSINMHKKNLSNIQPS